MLHSYQFIIVKCVLNKKNKKYMPLSKIDIISRNKVDRKSLCCSWREVEITECSFSFTTKFLYLFLFLVCLKWVLLKRLNIIWFVKFSQKFHSSNSFSSKGEGNLVTIIAGSLTVWIGVVTINRLAQAKFLF